MKSLLLFLSIVLFSACDIQEGKPEIPNKPSQVPHGALWVGGLDGGVFVLVEKNKNSSPNEYLGQIFYISGDLAYEGRLNILPENSAVIDYENPEIYQGWDGDTLYLSGNKQLKVPD